MKPFLSLLLSFILMVCLVGCSSQEPVPTTTTAPLPSTSSGPIHCHSYADADCTTPKTCTDCGYTRGEALGHDYMEGTCTRCGNVDTTFVPLVAGSWQTDALSENESQLELVILHFQEDGTASVSAELYHRLSDVPLEQREPYMENEDNWYNYSGEIYYYTQSRTGNQLTYQVDGNLITCTLVQDEVTVGTWILERTGGNMLTVTYFEGAFAIQFLQVGDVLSGKA